MRPNPIPSCKCGEKDPGQFDKRNHTTCKACNQIARRAAYANKRKKDATKALEVNKTDIFFALPVVKPYND